MTTFIAYLRSQGACYKAKDWAKGKTVEEAVQQCTKGEWLLWLGTEAGIDHRQLTLAKAHCANTVSHLCNDRESSTSINTAIAYAEGRITEEDLHEWNLHLHNSRPMFGKNFADSAADSTTFPNNIISDYASASHAAEAAHYAAQAAGHASRWFIRYGNAKGKNQKKTADICRKYIGQLIITAVNQKIRE